MEQEVYGVFFEDSGSEYLTAVFEDEEEASRYADEQDRAAFERALDDRDDDPERREPLSRSTFISGRTVATTATADVSSA